MSASRLSREQRSLVPLILPDLMFASSFLVLGSDFPVEIRRLVVRDMQPPGGG